MAYRGGGSKPGERRGGRKKGTKNKLTVEREKAARLAEERERLVAAAKAAEDKIAEAKASSKKLMKDIGFEAAYAFMALAVIHQPSQTWTRGADGKLVNANPDYDQETFTHYLKLAADTAAQFASYESPKLSAVMVGAAVVNEIEVIGGLPDELDGGLVAATDATRTIELTGTELQQGPRHAPDVSSGAGPGVQDQEQAEGAPVRKAVG